MLTEIIRFSLNNKFLVLILTALLALSGIYQAFHLPIDAVPDMTNVQVTVITNAGSLAPLEVERYITYPVEWTMAGLPRVEEIRSTSQFGLSVVTVVFREGTDIYWARALVNERILAAQGQIPRTFNPEIGPLTTALGEILQFEVRGEKYSPMQLRALLDWEISPQLRSVHGVTEINSHGGFYKSYEVRINPERLAGQGLTLEEVFDALEKNNLTAGGGSVSHQGERRFIRGQALLENADAVAQVVVRSQAGGSPVLIRDIAEVAVSPLVRQGAVTRDGRGEAVTGMTMMLFGENSRNVVAAVKQRLELIRSSLPPGVEIEILYDRTALIERTLQTVLTNLAEGSALVVIILLVALGSVRAGLIVAVAIPLSMLFATNLMAATGVTASLMSLGAIDFGLIVDSSVIMVENCMHRLAHNPENRPQEEVVLKAAIEVRKPTMFGEMIIAVVYLPILLLQGVEGKLFRPMAQTVLFALAGSLILSLTLMPVLAAIGLPRLSADSEEIWLVRWIKAVYRPLIRFVLRHRAVTVMAALGMLLAAIPVAWRLGGEFMPRLDEGDVLIETVRLPTATLEDAQVLTTRIETLLKQLPEVQTVFCKTGRPEIASDVMGVHQTDVWCILKPLSEWPQKKPRDQLVQEMSDILNQHIAGTSFSFSQPIEMRVNELVAGVKSDVAVLLYGDDLETLARKGKEIERALRGIPGAEDVKAGYQSNLSTLRVQVRPESLARYGIEAERVMNAVMAIGGRDAGKIYEGRARFPIVVRLPAAWREDIDVIGRIPVGKSGGRTVPLSALAELKFEETPPNIDHEATRRRTFVQANVRGRDIASFVLEAQRVVRERVELPPGYFIHWGGNFEHLQSATLRLLFITPLALLLVFMLLHTSMQSVARALLIFLAVPIAASGGVYALALRGMPFSISAGVGFIALFGVAVLNGLVWVSGAETLREQGYTPQDAAAETALARLRPVLMTATVASLGFLPMALATSSGAEIQRPLATVVIGGLVTATLLTSLVIPAVYPWFCPRSSVSPENPAA